MKKYHYPLPFSYQVLYEVIGHDCYNLEDSYSRYNQVKIVEEDQLKDNFTTPWSIFPYQVIPFGWCNALATYH